MSLFSGLSSLVVIEIVIAIIGIAIFAWIYKDPRKKGR